MRSKSLLLLAVVVAAVVVVSGLVQAQQPIRVGASIALTGRDAIQGGYVREGYLLCEKHVNEKGGVLGRPMEFLIRDDGSDPKTAVGLYGSPITDAVADVTEKHPEVVVAAGKEVAVLGPVRELGRHLLVECDRAAELGLGTRRLATT